MRRIFFLVAVMAIIVLAVYVPFVRWILVIGLFLIIAFVVLLFRCNWDDDYRMIDKFGKDYLTGIDSSFIQLGEGEITQNKKIRALENGLSRAINQSTKTYTFESDSKMSKLSMNKRSILFRNTIQNLIRNFIKINTMFFILARNTRREIILIPVI